MRAGIETASADLPASGLYVVLLRVEAPLALRVGALGECAFPAGWYAYTGSARRGLPKRVARHFAPEKPLRWHMDHLTTAAGVTHLGAVLLPASAGLSECALNRRVGELIGGTAPIPRFGASDCRAGCPAHLWHSARATSLSIFAAKIPAATPLRANWIQRL